MQEEYGASNKSKHEFDAGMSQLSPPLALPTASEALSLWSDGFGGSGPENAGLDRFGRYKRLGRPFSAFRGRLPSSSRRLASGALTSARTATSGVACTSLLRTAPTRQPRMTRPGRLRRTGPPRPASAMTAPSQGRPATGCGSGKERIRIRAVARSAATPCNSRGCSAATARHPLRCRSSCRSRAQAGGRAPCLSGHGSAPVLTAAPRRSASPRARHAGSRRVALSPSEKDRHRPKESRKPRRHSRSRPSPAYRVPVRLPEAFENAGVSIAPPL